MIPEDTLPTAQRDGMTSRKARLEVGRTIELLIMV